MANNVTSTVTLNVNAIRQLNRAATRVLEQTAEAIHTDLVQSCTMPRKKGALQNEATFVDTSRVSSGHVELVSSTPYARRLYYHPEYNFHCEPWEEYRKDGSIKDSGDGNPNAGGAWFAPYEQGGEKERFAQQVFERLYRREAGL